MAGPRRTTAKAKEVGIKGARILVVEARYYDAIADALLAGVKRALNEVAANRLDADALNEARRISAASEDHREGLRAWAEKREPQWEIA